MQVGAGFDRISMTRSRSRALYSFAISVPVLLILIRLRDGDGVKQGGNVGAVGNGIVLYKGKFGGGAQIHALRHLAADKARRGLQPQMDLLLIPAQSGVKHLGILEIGGHVHARNADKRAADAVLQRCKLPYWFLFLRGQ